MKENEERHLSIKLESLTDLVFGLALSIGALLLAISGISTPAQLESNIVTFGFSFLILIFVWSRYTAIISDLPEEVRDSRYTTYLSYCLLFLVAVEPYLFNILHTAGPTLLDFASSVYAMDIGLITLILAILISVMVRYDIRSNRKLTLPRRYYYIRNGCALISAVMIISAVPVLWQIIIFGIPARFFIWLVILPIMWLSRFIKNKHKEKKR